MILGIAIILMIGLVLIDQLIKHLVVTGIAVGASKVVIPGILSWTNLHNTGAAWSLFSDNNWIFYPIYGLAILAFIYFMWSFRKQYGYLFGIALMMAGTLGNLLDRVRLGYVVDMVQLDFVNYPIFNFADSCLVTGVAVIIIAMIYYDRKEKKSHDQRNA